MGSAGTLATFVSGHFSGIGIDTVRARCGYMSIGRGLTRVTGAFPPKGNLDTSPIVSPAVSDPRNITVRLR